MSQASRLAASLILTLLAVGRPAVAADPVWPPAVRYEDFLRVIELVTTDQSPDRAALDEAYRTYLERAGDLRRGMERARSEFDRTSREVSAGLGTIDDVDRAWIALRRAENQAAIAEDELGAGVLALVPSCPMSASALALRLRLADAFSSGGQGIAPFSMLLAFRPEPVDRALMAQELERLLPVAQRYLREGADLAVERLKAFLRYREEFPPPSEETPEQAMVSQRWADGWTERRFVTAAARDASEVRFVGLVDAALERLLAGMSPPGRIALLDAWNHASGVTNFSAKFLLPWQGVTADAATVAAARERVAEFLRHDRDEAKAYRKLDRDEAQAWLGVYADLEQPSAEELRAAERRLADWSERLNEARSDIGSRRLNTSRSLLAELTSTLGGAPVGADLRNGQRPNELVWLDEMSAQRTVARRPLVASWQTERETTLPHRWLPPDITEEWATELARRLERPDAAGAALRALQALRTATSAISITPVRESTMGLTPEEVTKLRDEIHAARAILARAQPACREALRSIATDERERAIVEVMLVEAFGGDPVHCTMSRSLQPWTDHADQRARHGNIAWALERSGLDAGAMSQARAIVARFSTELLAAMEAYDAKEADAAIDACAWPRTPEEVEQPHDGEVAVRRAQCREGATDALDQAASERDRICERVRKALHAELPTEVSDRIRRAERVTLAPDLAPSTKAFLDRLERAEFEARRAHPDASDAIDILRDRIHAHVRSLDDQIAAIAWRPEAFHLWWPNEDLGATDSGPDADRGRRERRKWLLFVREETRLQWLTAMERLAEKEGGE
ncbi:MAG: hypothetical protein JNL80_07790 [Phycisphaerae bacterium]|nr:hypothetical protein [Phycisphaerae bacterium]